MNWVWVHPRMFTDVRELISVEDVMDELKYGPNGGLLFCMECVVR